MGVNDDRLSAGEQNELRALVTAGAGRMRAARRRRMQAITGGAAVLLVAAVVGAVALTALGSPDRVATPIETTMSPSPTPTLTPTPTPTPTPEPDPASQALGGDCARVMSDDEVALIIGPGAEARHAHTQPAALGGLSCEWLASGSQGQYVLLMVGVYPLAAVPEDIRVRGSEPECGMVGCFFAGQFGDAWVVAQTADEDMARRVVDLVGPRAQAEPGRPGVVDAAVSLPECAAVETAAGQELGAPTIPFQGDSLPMGIEWDLLEETGVAQYCTFWTDTDLSRAEVFLSRGSTDIDGERLASIGGTPIALADGTTVWLVPASDTQAAMALGATGNAVLQVVWAGGDTERLPGLWQALNATLG
ncbi:hypothetical protein [Microbacterium binotii]|uniref:hypothetical protein n=1 Tax=Microbacterium binotii TaxID=462710 RepID=UPI001F28BC9B|nr:hypothetical protein [Microbacterium binotii]UIN29730.1 hypothetical protein LXM64_11300 [Microbacterium binotii]